ncbi:MAG: hypothetical protein AAGB15_08095 [Pseudomonadota bacterium]
MGLRFLNDDRGGVTVDWVALVAGVLLLGMTVVYGIFNTGVAPMSKNLNSTLSDAESFTEAVPPLTQNNFSD